MLKSKFLSVFLILSTMFSSSAVLANDDEIEVQVEAVYEESNSDNNAITSASLATLSFLVLMYGFHKAYEAYDVYQDQTSGRVRYCEMNARHSALGAKNYIHLNFGSSSSPIRKSL